MSTNKNATKQRLLKAKPKMDCDVWEILGEDPNCDFGGCHSQPHLMYLKSTYEEAIDVALYADGFFTWGSGGDIKPVRILTLQDVRNIPKLRERKKELERELETVNITLGTYKE